MKNQYNKTVAACFVGYIVQAIVNNFVPLLFLTFQRTYHIPLSQITLLVTLNFGMQLLVDLVSVRFVDKAGYRVSMIVAHILSAAGLILLTVLPELLDTPFAGILIAVMIYAAGGGLLEVVVSPVVEACPSDNKEMAMQHAAFFLLLGACWRSASFHAVFSGSRHGKLEDAGINMGSNPSCQCGGIYKSSHGIFVGRRGNRL